MDVIKRIKELLEQRGWSEYKLSAVSKVNQSTISTIFSRNTPPTIPILEMICEGFGMTLSEFFSSRTQAVELTDEQWKLLNRWRLLTPKQKESILNLMESF